MDDALATMRRACHSPHARYNLEPQNPAILAECRAIGAATACVY